MCGRIPHITLLFNGSKTMNRSCGYANMSESCCETLRLQVEAIFNMFFGSRRQYRRADKKTDDQDENDNEDNDDDNNNVLLSDNCSSTSSDSSFSTVISSNSAGDGSLEDWVHCTGAGELSTHNARDSHGGMAPRLLH